MINMHALLRPIKSKYSASMVNSKYSQSCLSIVIGDQIIQTWPRASTDKDFQKWLRFDHQDNVGQNLAMKEVKITLDERKKFYQRIVQIML